MNKNLDFVPRGLERIFKNLKAIYVPNGRIKDIRREDISMYHNLMYLDFGACDIRFIEDGTFDSNKNLEIIWMNSNMIFHIDPDVFKNLNKLSFLGLKNNLCIDVDVRGNLQQVQSLIKSANEKCLDEEFYKLLQDLKLLESSIKSMKMENFEIWNYNREVLEESFKNSRFTNIKSLAEKFEILRHKIPILQIKFLNQVELNLQNSQTESLSIIDGKLSEFEEKMYSFGEDFNQLYKKLNKTDEKLDILVEKTSSIEENCENLKNFAALFSKNFQIIEKDQQKIKSKIQEIEDKFLKIDEKTKKIVDILQGY